MKRLLVVAGASLTALLALPTAAQAHPLGNFTVNQYAGLRLSTGAVTVDYVLDMAELPAFQTRTQEVDADHDGAVSDAENASYAQRTCATVKAATTMKVNDESIPLTGSAGRLSFPPGTAGLTTLRLECSLTGSVHIGEKATIEYAADAYRDRIGWREVTAQGDGVTVASSDVPATSVTRRLTAYPQDALNTALDVRRAIVEVRPGGGAAPESGASGPTEQARGVDRLTAAFTDFVARRDLSVGLGVLALLLALALGAGHALAPGHGKTVLAAYLVGQRGSLRQALTVAVTVALTHTAGVLVLGVLLATSTWFAPQRVYEWLAVASGVLIALVGVILLRRTYASWRHQRSHHHDHPHEHPEPKARSMVAMGLAGGLSPSPSAVVVLLGAVALGRAWFGVLLVAGYGVGMAATLTGLGFALSRWRFRLEHRLRISGIRLLPMASSAVVLLVGLGIAAQAALR